MYSVFKGVLLPDMPLGRRPMKRIAKITVRTMLDECPDTSWLGEYTDDLEPGIIVRVAREYCERLPEDYELPPRGREFRGFRPYAGGEQPGTEDYCKYGMQDFERMESFAKGDWHFVGIRAEAEVLSSRNGKEWLINRLSSGGLWGIESDSEASYFDEVKREEIQELKATLMEYGFTRKQIESAFKNVEERPKIDRG